jgi:hypothetical protein
MTSAPSTTAALPTTAVLPTTAAPPPTTTAAPNQRQHFATTTTTAASAQAMAHSAVSASKPSVRPSPFGFALFVAPPWTECLPNILVRFGFSTFAYVHFLGE